MENSIAFVRVNALHSSSFLLAGILFSLFGLTSFLLYEFRWANERQRKFEKRLESSSLLLQELLGPLNELVRQNQAAWAVFEKRHYPDGLSDVTFASFTDHERMRWREWDESIIRPIRLKIGDILERNAHLLHDEALATVLRDMLEKARTARLMASPLETDPDSQTFKAFALPVDFVNSVTKAYSSVVQERNWLQAKISWPSVLGDPPVESGSKSLRGARGQHMLVFLATGLAALCFLLAFNADRRVGPLPPTVGTNIDATHQMLLAQGRQLSALDSRLERAETELARPTPSAPLSEYNLAIDGGILFWGVAIVLVLVLVAFCSRFFGISAPAKNERSLWSYLIIACAAALELATNIAGLREQILLLLGNHLMGLPLVMLGWTIAYDASSKNWRWIFGNLVFGLTAPFIFFVPGPFWDVTWTEVVTGFERYIAYGSNLGPGYWVPVVFISSLPALLKWAVFGNLVRVFASGTSGDESGAEGSS